MADNTNIEWADKTFNPWLGCQKKNEGCLNCYAEKLASTRMVRMGKMWGPGSIRKRTSKDNWKMPFRWNKQAAISGKRPRVFPSMMDPFEDNDQVKEVREEFWDLIRQTPHIDWLLLTKNPENIKKLLPLDWGQGYKNVWLGVSICMESHKEMLYHLVGIPAVCRFLSIEPLLGYIPDIFAAPDDYIPGIFEPFWSTYIDWVIVGGESGSKARISRIENIEDIVLQCEDAKVPVFVKQLGSNPVWNVQKLYLASKGGDISEFPEHLRVRQFPKPRI